MKMNTRLIAAVTSAAIMCCFFSLAIPNRIGNPPFKSACRHLNPEFLIREISFLSRLSQNLNARRGDSSEMVGADV